jgi:DNA topoisomerase III
LGHCPKCNSNVFEHGMSYVCEKSVGAGKNCDFRSGKIILQQPIEPAQMTKLLTEGKTDLLLGFISSRTRRKFKAYLVKGADGKTSFEFEQRAAKDPAAGKKAGAKKAAKASDAADEVSVTAKAGKAPAGKKAAAKKVASKAPAKKAASKTVASKTPAAKKAATKTPAAKKPAAKKPAAKTASVKKEK